MPLKCPQTPRLGNACLVPMSPRHECHAPAALPAPAPGPLRNPGQCDGCRPSVSFGCRDDRHYPRPEARPYRRRLQRAKQIPVFSPPARYASRVALVRILVDGYSLLHNWPELAPGRPRHSAAAREELIHALTQYRDATGTPITIFFDGGGAPAGTPQARSTPEMEIIYSRAGRTADDLIERTAYRLREFGEVLVVTDDYAERDTVIGFGCMAWCGENFIQSIHDATRELEHDLKIHNRRERQRFQQTASR